LTWTRSQGQPLTGSGIVGAPETDRPRCEFTSDYRRQS